MVRPYQQAERGLPTVPSAIRPRPVHLNPDGDRFFVLPTIQTPGLKTVSFPPSAAPKGY